MVVSDVERNLWFGCSENDDDVDEDERCFHAVLNHIGLSSADITCALRMHRRRLYHTTLKSIIASVSLYGAHRSS